MDIIYYILLSLLILFAGAFMISFFILLYFRNCYKKLENHYRKTINNVILNDDLVESSIETICMAYGIETGNLKNYICKEQKNEKSQDRS